MRCQSCNHADLKLSYSHPILLRLLLLLVLCHKFRCRHCRKGQIGFLPLYWLSLANNLFSTKS